MRKICCIATVLLLFTTLSAQHFIKGKVINQQGVPLVGATVKLHNTTEIKITDSDGTFIFKNVTDGQYLVEASFIGYKNVVQKTLVDKELRITLDAIAYAIDEITVSSLRATSRSAIAHSNVTNEDIEQRNVGQDIPYLLSFTPSFVPTSDAGTGIGYTSLRIRGTDGNRINVTINGVPLNDAESHSVYFVDMPDFASSLSSVQIQRGVGSSTNGTGAFGASINMQTAPVHHTPFAEFSTTLGSFCTNKNTIQLGSGLLHNNFAVDARLSNLSSDGYIDRAWVKMQSYYLATSYLTDNTRITLLTFGGKEKTYQAWNGVDADSLATNRTYNELGKYTNSQGNTMFYDNQTDNYTQTHYQLHYTQICSPVLQVQSTLHYTKGIGYYEEYKKSQPFVNYGLVAPTLNRNLLYSTNLVRQKWLDNDYMGLTCGLQYNTTKCNMSLGGAVSRYDGEHFGRVVWAQYANNMDIDNEYYRSKSTKNEANIFGKIDATWMNDIVTSLDVQYRTICYNMVGTIGNYDRVTQTMRDITQGHLFNFFNPKLGLVYKLGINNDIYTSFSVAHREPNRNNYTDAGQNERPTHERLYDTELGYRFRSQKLNLSANAYYMRYKNQLILTGKMSEIGEMLTSNIPDSYRMGIELEWQATIFEWLKWNGNTTISSNKIHHFTEQGIDEYDANGNWIGSKDNILGTRDISFSPPLVANSIIAIQLKNVQCNIHSHYVGKQYIDNTSDSERSINDYLVHNVSVQYALPLDNKQFLDFNLSIQNLFNRQYETNGYTWYSYYVDGVRKNELRFFPQAGINVLTSIKLHF